MVDGNRQYAYFSLRGSFEPAEVTARIGLEPTESWRKGEIDSKTQRERRVSRWSLRSRLPETEPLEGHIRDVLAQLDVRGEAVREVARQAEACMQLVAYFYGDYPGLHFDRDITEGLARYALDVDFDFYYLYSHQREDTDAAPADASRRDSR
jgi:Domain of unknown function (DUF4279)